MKVILSSFKGNYFSNKKEKIFKGKNFDIDIKTQNGETLSIAIRSDNKNGWNRLYLEGRCIRKF